MCSSDLSQPPWFHQKTSKTRSQDRRWAAPSLHEDMYSTPGPRKGSGLPPGLTSLRGVAKTRRSQGSAVLKAAGLLPMASPVQKRIRTPTQALGARRLGLQEEERASVLVGGGVSALPPLFLKSDSDSTWTRMEEKQPRRFHVLGEGFLPAKNPSTSFWVALGCLLAL